MSELKLITELTLIALYKSRFTRLECKLVNPSEAHLKRLYTMGHDLHLNYYNEKKEIVKSEFKKY